MSRNGRGPEQAAPASPGLPPCCRAVPALLGFSKGSLTTAFLPWPSEFTGTRPSLGHSHVSYPKAGFPSISHASLQLLRNTCWSRRKEGLCHYKPQGAEVQRKEATGRWGGGSQGRESSGGREVAKEGKLRKVSQYQVSLNWAWLGVKCGALLPPLELCDPNWVRT